MFKNNKHKELSKNIANVISFLPSLVSDIKINMKENENKLNDENLKYYEKKFAMLDIERKNYLNEKRFKTELNIHKTYVLNILLIMLAVISVSLTLLGTNVLDNLFTQHTVVNIKSFITIMLMFAVMFISYYLSSQLGMIRQRFNNLFKLAIVLILSCITVSVYFNFMFLQSILTIDNVIIKIIISLLKSVLLDVSISVLLFYRNCRQTLAFSYETEYVKQETEIKHTSVKPKTETIKQKTETKHASVEPKTETIKQKTETENISVKPKTETKHTSVKPKTENSNISFEKKLKLIKEVINKLDDNEKVDFKNMSHFLTRYDWDKAKGILIKDGLIYIDNRKCLKSPTNTVLEIVK